MLQAEPAFWCPMHHDVRGRQGDKCPICSMRLVPAAPADYEPSLLELETIPRAVRAGQTARVKFVVRDARSGAIVKRFDTVHERIFHLFVLSQDLDYFVHTHPVLRHDGSLDVGVDFPRAGVYRLIADFLPAGGSPQLVQKAIVTAGYRGPLVATPRLAADTSDKVAGDTRVKLTLPAPRGGREQLITFDLEDAASGRPVTGLEPYLGAAGHLLLATSDLDIVMHSHPVPELSQHSASTIVFQVLFPRAGDYRLWVQFQRSGKVHTASFTTTAAEPD